MMRLSRGALACWASSGNSELIILYGRGGRRWWHVGAAQSSAARGQQVDSSACPRPWCSSMRLSTCRVGWCVVERLEESQLTLARRQEREVVEERMIQCCERMRDASASAQRLRGRPQRVDMQRKCRKYVRTWSREGGELPAGPESARPRVPDARPRDTRVSCVLRPPPSRPAPSGLSEV